MADLESSGTFHYAVLNERMDGQRRRTERFVVRGESESRGRSWKEVVGPERAVAHGMRSQRKWQGAGTPAWKRSVTRPQKAAFTTALVEPEQCVCVSPGTHHVRHRATCWSYEGGSDGVCSQRGVEGRRVWR